MPMSGYWIMRNTSNTECPIWVIAIVLTGMIGFLAYMIIEWRKQ